MKRRGFRGKLSVCALGLSALATGCDDTTSEPAATFEIAGQWSSAFGSETISATRWLSFDTDGQLAFEQKVTRFDNTNNAAIVQNLETAEYGPNTYGRVVWTEPTATGFSYCTVTFGHATAAQAEAAPEADIKRDDLQTGCAGFPWSTLTKK